MRSIVRLVAFSCALAAAASTAQASAITYKGALASQVPVAAVSTQDNLDPTSIYNDDPVGADYWSMSLGRGNVVRISARSTASHFFDPVLWIFRLPTGLYTDTAQFQSSYLTPGDANFIAFFDDPLVGFGDAAGLFTAPTAGIYTFIVTSGLSDSGAPDSYVIQADVIPEPATLVLFGTGLALVTRAARRRSGQPTARG